MPTFTIALFAITLFLYITSGSAGPLYPKSASALGELGTSNRASMTAAVGLSRTSAANTIAQYQSTSEPSSSSTLNSRLQTLEGRLTYIPNTPLGHESVGALRTLTTPTLPLILPPTSTPSSASPLVQTSTGFTPLTTLSAAATSPAAISAAAISATPISTVPISTAPISTSAIPATPPPSPASTPLAHESAEAARNTSASLPTSTATFSFSNIQLISSSQPTLTSSSPTALADGSGGSTKPNSGITLSRWNAVHVGMFGAVISILLNSLS